MHAKLCEYLPHPLHYVLPFNLVLSRKRHDVKKAICIRNTYAAIRRNEMMYRFTNACTTIWTVGRLSSADEDIALCIHHPHVAPELIVGWTQAVACRTWNTRIQGCEWCRSHSVTIFMCCCEALVAVIFKACCCSYGQCSPIFLQATRPLWHMPRLRHLSRAIFVQIYMLIYFIVNDNHPDICIIL